MAKGTIYLIEDNPTWVATLKSKLASLGYEVVSFSAGETFLKKLHSEGLNPNIVIIDYHLEGKYTGLDVLKELKTLHPNAFAIMFSGQESLEIALQTLDNGAYDYIVKDEDAVERLRIILENIENLDRLERESKELVIKIKTAQIGVVVVVLLIFLIVSGIYLYLCPDERIIKWDPFKRANSPACRV